MKPVQEDLADALPLPRDYSCAKSGDRISGTELWQPLIIQWAAQDG